MSAKNWMFTVKFVAVEESATTVAAPIPVPGPGSRPVRLPEVTHVSPPAVMVAIIRVGTACGPVAPGPGLVQLVLPSHVAMVPPPLMPLKVMESSTPLRPAVGRAADDEPQ